MSTTPRPFKIDYAGAFPGHACTREGAINAAGRHLVSDGYTAATITDIRTGHVVAQVRMSDNRKGYTVTTERQLRKAAK